MYEVVDEIWIRRISDGAWIPQDERNIDYQAYLIWLKNQPMENNNG